MPRYQLTIEYDGSPYHGWQIVNGPSVQGTIESALMRLHGGVRHEVVAAGRTDAGVHALGQVAHVDLPRDWADWKLREALNAQLWPESVAILSVARAKDDFHARFSASARRYLYRICDRRAHLTFDRGRAMKVPVRLDEIAMQQAANLLVGHHDFTTFRDAQCQASSPMRTLDRLDVERAGDEVHIRAQARSFLHRQVRSMVGTLVEVGGRRWPVERVGEALAARNRAACGQVAPACGLYLAEVVFDSARDLPACEDAGFA